MEPLQTYGATSPQQGLTQPAEGCPSGPRSEDLMQGGHEGANPQVGTRVANDAVDCATAGTSQTPEVSANVQGGCSRLQIFECFYAESKNYKKNGSPDNPTPSELTIVVFREMGQHLKDLSSSEKDRLIREVVKPFLCKSMTYYKKCRRNKKRFQDKHGVFLNKQFIDDIPDEFKRVVSPLPEAPSDPMSYKQDFISKKRIMETLESEPQSKVIKSVASMVSSDDRGRITPKESKDLEKIIETCLKSPKRASVVLNKNSEVTKPYTPEEALGVIIERKLSVETYKLMQEDLYSRGYPAYPSYHEILNAKKACYPAEDIQVSEVEASVSLQGLLTHTFQRIVLSCEDSFIEYCNRKGTQEVACVFEVSWGFDGSVDELLYNQCFPKLEEEISINEKRLFATTFIPIRIVADNHFIPWVNPAPQSYRFCRPLHIQYKKETSDLILSEKICVEEQIKSLLPITTQTSEGHNITSIVCDLNLSVIDGKVLNIISGTSSQLRCLFCKLPASRFNDLGISYTKPTIKENMRHGINPLHAWIRVFEFLLHLSYKNDPLVRKWRINKDSNESLIDEQRKKRIQGEIRTRIGLLVDVVKPNAGTTNDVNSARTALSDKFRGIFTEILGLEPWLVDGLHVILVTISCELPIDTKKFGIFCRTLAERYVHSYNWHPMTATVHKILLHGEEIIESCLLPVGILSEQAAESHNKWCSDLKHHCRKMNGRKAMIDLFHRALESSDPFISMAHFNQHRRYSKRLALPEAVRELLKPIHEKNLQLAEEDGEDPFNYDEDPPNNDDDFPLTLRNESDLYG